MKTEDIEAKRAELARDLNCLTSVELRTLAGITPITETAWCKRGVGPRYIIFGTQRLYPKDGVAEFLRDRIRARKPVPGKAAL